MKKLLAMILAAAMALSLCACGGKTDTPAADAPKTDAPAASDTSTGSAPDAGAETPEDDGVFSPRLDTELTATVEIAGFMGNFEALDQAINAFNEIYPNVTFLYDHNTAYLLPDYLESNAGVDIFMTDDMNLKQPDYTDYYVADRCLDLSAEGISASAVLPDALSDCTVDGALLRLPLAMNPCGVVVNKTLLAKEGLTVPQDYDDFLYTLETLKARGYTPIQGSEQHVYGELAVSMAMNLLAGDPDTLDAMRSGADTEGAAVLPALEKLAEIVESGYTDYELNCTYPADNYDGSIMAFFEGDMPFYVCLSECVSGMKKRESKPETFSAAPFEYEFMYVPFGEDGVYAYSEPWYGFSVNKDSEEKDISVEFLRFLATREQLDAMAATKGMPSVTSGGGDARYAAIYEPAFVEASFVNDGSVPDAVRDAFVAVCNAFGAGEYETASEAAAAFAAQCAEIG